MDDFVNYTILNDDRAVIQKDISFWKEYPDSIYITIYYGKLETLMFLVSLGIDPTSNNLYNACYFGFLEAVLYIMAFGVKPTSEHLLCTCQSGYGYYDGPRDPLMKKGTRIQYMEIMKHLIEKGVVPTDVHLEYAVRSRFTDAVIYLIDICVPVSKRLMLIACENYDIDTMKVLCENGKMKVTQKCLKIACCNGQLDIIKFLVNKCLVATYEMLNYTVEFEYVDCFNYLILCGNVKPSQEMFLYVCLRGRFKYVESILQTCKTMDINTAVTFCSLNHYAKFKSLLFHMYCQDYFEVFELLLKHGADTNADKDGGVFQYIFCNNDINKGYSRDYKYVKLLLSHGVKYNKTVVIDKVIALNRSIIMMILLQHGIVDIHLEKIEKWAKSEKHQEIMDFLIFRLRFRNSVMEMVTRQ